MVLFLTRMLPILVILLCATTTNAILLDSIVAGVNSILKLGGSLSEPVVKDKYDFVVVGSGSAGAVIASRLSEKGRFSVLLLEAGGQPSFLSDYPLFWPLLQNTAMDWSYRTTPQKKSCEACENYLVPVPRGKAIGGCTAINAMMYVRGNRNDYDRWAKLGNEGWSYDEVLPYFLKSENNLNPSMVDNKKYHATGGEVFVRDMPYHTPLVDYFLKAGNETGHFETPDINGIKQTGVNAEQVTMDKQGHRWGTKHAYLDPAKDRTNLHVLPNAFVTKVLFNSNKEATGVEYIYNKERKTVEATKEVILSAGVIGSPQILLLSGVGPEADLKKLNIPVVKDLPGVGENLQEHPMTWGLIWHVDIAVKFINIKSLLPALIGLAETFLSQLLTGTNALSANTGLEGLGFVKTSFADKSVDWPDLELQFIATSEDLPYGEEIRKVTGFNKKVFDDFFSPAMNANGFTILPILISGKSAGNLKLDPDNREGYPIIDPKFFDNDEDRQKLVEGLQIAYDIGQSAAFKEVGAKFYDKNIPGCEGIAIGTKAYWECMVTKYTPTAWHPVGTCKMGPDSDPLAVVDSKLKVRGVKKLRVADGSNMPMITRGNTNAPTIMIGEKAADMILSEYP